MKEQTNVEKLQASCDQIIKTSPSLAHDGYAEFLAGDTTITKACGCVIISAEVDGVQLIGTFDGKNLHPAEFLEASDEHGWEVFRPAGDAEAAAGQLIERLQSVA